jgi:hypothetical protein
LVVVALAICPLTAMTPLGTGIVPADDAVAAGAGVAVAAGVGVGAGVGEGVAAGAGVALTVIAVAVNPALALPRPATLTASPTTSVPDTVVEDVRATGTEAPPDESIKPYAVDSAIVPVRVVLVACALESETVAAVME